jgi:hypothetical protein
MEEIGLDAGQSAVLLARKTSPARVAEWCAPCPLYALARS